MRAARLAPLVAAAVVHASENDRMESVEHLVGERLFPGCPRCTADLAGTHSLSYAAASPDTALMKLHFTEFSLPTGAAVQVCGPRRAAGSQECHTYGTGIQMATRDRAYGEDGAASFGALSVDGAQVTVTLVVPEHVAWGAQHGATVARIKEFGGRMAAPAGRSARGQSICGMLGYRDPACYRDASPDHYAKSMAVARAVVGLTSRTCTAWRVTRNNLMLTNEHCIGDQEILESAEFHFNFQRSECGGSEHSATLKLLGGNLKAADSTLDFALFSLSRVSYEVANQWRGERGELIGHLYMSKREPEVGTAIYIPQHPSGNVKKIALAEDRPSGLCEVRDMAPEGHDDWSSYKMGYRCDTMGGSSGAPIIRASDHTVVGLHSNAGCQGPGITDGTNKGTKASHIWVLMARYLSVTSYPTHWPGIPAPPPRSRTPSTWFPTPGANERSFFPTGFPASGWPSSYPGTTLQPTGFPVVVPTEFPTGYPSNGPTDYPTKRPPTGYPSRFPSAPTGFPSRDPTAYPTRRPRAPPTGFPSRWPSGWPSSGPSVPSAAPTRAVTAPPSTATPAPTATKQPQKGVQITRTHDPFIGGFDGDAREAAALSLSLGRV